MDNVCWDVVALSVLTTFRVPRFSLSTLEAGVSRGGGDSALRLNPAVIVVSNGGGNGGSPAAGINGVEPGVGAGVLLEYVRGRELWLAIDWICSVCCCVWCAARISSKTTIVQYPSREDIMRHCPSGDLWERFRVVQMEGVVPIPCDIREFIIVQLSQQANRSSLLSVIDSNGIHGRNGVEHSVWQRKY